MKTISLFLLLTLGAFEQTYGPYVRPERGGNHSLTAARGNVLLAWSERTATGHARVHVVLLDGSGRAISPIRVLPALSPTRDALVPAVGTDGASFLVVWEEVLGMQQTVAMALAPNGEPAGEPHALGIDTPILSNAYETARVHWTGGAYAVYSGTKSSWRVAADGALLGPITGTPPVAVGSNGTFARASTTRIPMTSGGFGRPGSGTSTAYYYSVGWTAGSRSGADQVLPFNTDPSEPYITAAGDQFLVVWTTPSTINYRLTSEPQRRYTAGFVDVHARPRADCTATHCVVVYRTRAGNVEGFVFDHTRPDPPVHFQAAKSARVEIEPEVSMVTNSRALITWRSIGSDGDEKLAGRTLSLGSRRRAAQ